MKQDRIEGDIKRLRKKSTFWKGNLKEKWN